MKTKKEKIMSKKIALKVLTPKIMKKKKKKKRRGMRHRNRKLNSVP